MSNFVENPDEHIEDVLNDIRSGRYTGNEHHKWIKSMLKATWEEGARTAYDLASDDIGAWDNLLEFPDELPDVAKNPYNA